MNETIEIMRYETGQLDALMQHKTAILDLVEEYRQLDVQAGQKVYEIGRHLTAVRELLWSQTGNLTQWTEQEIGMSPRQAYRFMNVYERVPPELIGKVPLSGMYMLAERSTPEEARLAIAQRIEQGEQLSLKEVEGTVKHYRQEHTRQATQADVIDIHTTERVQTVCGWCNKDDVPVYPMNEGGVGICEECVFNALKHFRHLA